MGRKKLCRLKILNSVFFEINLTLFEIVREMKQKTVENSDIKGIILFSEIVHLIEFVRSSKLGIIK